MTGRARIFAAIVGAALAVRLVPGIVDPSVPADFVEYQNVAENLLAGRGFLLDVAAYHATADRAVHYSGYTRAHGLPLVLAGLETVLPARWVAVAIGPLLYGLALVLALDWLVRVGFGREAPWVGALLALQPGLIDATVRPLSEPLTLLCVVLALWAHARLRSPGWTGLACGAAFLARPTGALVGVVLGCVYGLRALREGRWRDLTVFSGAAALGPAFMVGTNLAAGAPMLQSPQAFLWRAVDYLDGLRFVNRGGLYPSTGALLADRGLPFVLAAVLSNALAYAKTFVSATPGLGYLLPLLAFAPFGTRSAPRGSGLGLLLLVGVLDIALYCVAWSTRDVYRYPGIVYFAVIVTGGALVARGLFVLGERAEGRAATHLVPAAFGVVLALWATDAVIETAGVVGGGRPQNEDVNANARLAGLDESHAAKQALREALGPARQDPSPVVASNEAWLVTHAFDRPAFILPYDVHDGDWLDYIAAREGAAVVLHLPSWPDAYRGALESLTEALRSVGWRRTLAEGEIEVWIAPRLEERQVGLPSPSR
jgi:hypothetical protein